MKSLRFVFGILTALIMLVFMIGCGNNDIEDNTEDESQDTQGIHEPHDSQNTPGIDHGPQINYTWEEYIALNDDQKLMFKNSFEGPEAFDEWLNKNRPSDTETSLAESTVPTTSYTPGIAEPGKDTEASSDTQVTTQRPEVNPPDDTQPIETQPVEPQPVETQPVKTQYPWEKTGAKKPSEYTWAEFEALSGEEQMAFQNTFESTVAFDEWMNKAQGNDKQYPWEKTGAKKPSEYTWEEFETLNGEEQVAFQNTFESTEAFEEWMNKAQQKKYKWEEEGAKKPSEYTWEEFEALSGEEQMAFQFAFETEDGFENWYNKNNKDEN